MYSGIIRHRGTVIDRNDLQDGGAIFRFSAPSDILERLKLGSSINVAGVCLTVVKKDAESFSTDVMPQTLRLSTAMDWSVGTPVNLESSLRLGEELGGHLIFGHVDGVATIVDDRKDGNARLLTFHTELEHPFVSRGSISLDGVSLTISDAIKHGAFCISMTIETLARTTFKEKKIGDRVNVEIDMLQRYFYGTTHQSSHASH